jgi:hypothetical protein
LSIAHWSASSSPNLPVSLCLAIQNAFFIFEAH